MLPIEQPPHPELVDEPALSPIQRLRLLAQQGGFGFLGIPYSDQMNHVYAMNAPQERTGNAFEDLLAIIRSEEVQQAPDEEDFIRPFFGMLLDPPYFSETIRYTHDIYDRIIPNSHRDTLLKDANIAYSYFDPANQYIRGFTDGLTPLGENGGYYANLIEHMRHLFIKKFNPPEPITPIRIDPTLHYLFGNPYLDDIAGYVLPEDPMVDPIQGVPAEYMAQFIKT